MCDDDILSVFLQNVIAVRKIHSVYVISTCV